MGESGPVALLLLLTFTSGIALVSFETAAYALFLDHFDAANLPFVYLISAFVTTAIGLLYTRLERRVSVDKLLPGTLAAMFGSVLGLRVLLALVASPWVLMWVLLWQDVLTMLSILATWGLVLRSLNVRQGKRLFGLINAGELLGGMAAGLAAGLFVGPIGTPNLLFVVAASLLTGLWALGTFLRRYPRGLSNPDDEEDEEEEEEPEIGIIAMMRQSYPRAIFLLSAISVVGFFGLDYVYSAMVESRFGDEDAMARFLGPVIGLSQLATLIGTGLLSSRLMARFGLRASLLFLPMGMLLIWSLAVIIPEQGPLLFVVVVAAKMLDSFLRGSIEDSAMLVLYQPLDPRMRASAQAAAEGVVEPMAAGLASLLLFLAIGDGSNVQSVIEALLLPMVLWLVVSWRVGDGYARALVQAIDLRRLTGRALSLTDASTVDIFRSRLSSPHPGEVVYSLDALTRADYPQLGDLLIELLNHPVGAVRREALTRLERRGELGEMVDLVAVERLVAVEPEPEVRAKALRLLCSLGSDEVLDRASHYMDVSVPVVRRAVLVGLLLNKNVGVVLTASQWLSRMAESEDANQRRLSAEVLGELGAPGSHPVLLPLLLDTDNQVCHAALNAAGRVRHRRLWPALIARLDRPGLRAAAAEALEKGGQDVVPLLADLLTDTRQPRGTRCRVADLCGRIGGERVFGLLDGLIEEPDEQVRHHVLRALAAAGYRPDAAATLRLNSALNDEIERFTALLSAREPLARTSPWSELRGALQSQALAARDRIFLMLALLYDARRLLLARKSLEHRWSQRRAWAMEVVDVVVPSELKSVIVPMIDEITESERVRALSVRFPPQQRAAMELIADIVRGNDDAYSLWTRMCALRIAAVLRLTGLIPDVAALLNSPEPALRETALWTLADLDTPVSLSAASATRLGRSIVRDGEVSMLLTVEKVIILKTVEIFSQTPEEILVDVAGVLQEVKFAAGKTVFHKGDYGSTMYFIVSGNMKVHDGDTIVAELGDREIVGELAVLDPQPRSASVTAVTDVVLLQLDQDALYELMTDRVEVARGIIKVLCGKLRAYTRRSTDVDGDE